MNFGALNHLGRMRPPPAIERVDSTHILAAPPSIDSAIVPRSSSMRTVKSARRVQRQRVLVEKIAFALLFVANAMLLGAIVGLLASGA